MEFLETCNVHSLYAYVNPGGRRRLWRYKPDYNLAASYCEHERPIRCVSRDTCAVGWLHMGRIRTRSIRVLYPIHQTWIHPCQSTRREQNLRPSSPLHSVYLPVSHESQSIEQRRVFNDPGALTMSPCRNALPSRKAKLHGHMSRLAPINMSRNG